MSAERDLPPWMTGTGCGTNGRAVQLRFDEAGWRAVHPKRPTMRTVRTAAEAAAMRSIGRQLRKLKAGNARKLRSLSTGGAA